MKTLLRLSDDVLLTVDDWRRVAAPIVIPANASGVALLATLADADSRAQAAHNDAGAVKSPAPAA